MAANKQALNYHARLYIADVFEHRLRDEGFVCPDEKLLCWYRIKNQDIINSVIFYSPWNSIPVWMDIGYGIHPLFQYPAYIPSVSYANRPINHEIFSHQPLVEDVPYSNMRYMPYSEEVQVVSPGYEGKGIFTLDGILLPKMDSVQSVEACYALHKKSYEKGKCFDDPSLNINFSETFIDEAIYVDDAEVFPFFKVHTDYVVRYYEEQCQKNPSRREYKEALLQWGQRKEFLLTGDQDAYKAILDKRKAENINKLKKKLNMPV